jgi:hypothetical protein
VAETKAAITSRRVRIVLERAEASVMLLNGGG